MAVLGVKDNTLPQIALTQSQTFVPPQDGNICIHVIGAGGGGAGEANAARSGAAGGYCKKNSLAVTTGGSFTVVVGVGGAGVFTANTGGNGGNSTVAGTGLSATLTANGGTGAQPSAYGAGGTASNGDVNNTGGAGTAGGGGAVGIYATGKIGRNNITAGESDAQGGESGFGHIGGGGTRQSFIQNQVAGVTIDAPDGGFLAGGGATSQLVSAYAFGGNGGIGGGGGGAGGNSNANGATFGGDGGDGLVLIQYLPS